METKNKQQWTCHSSTTSIGIHGQPGPEDLSANRNGQSKGNDDFNKHNLANNDKQLTNELFNKKGLDQFLAQQVENSLCENSRKTIAQILDDVSKLTSTEKLLLYLKLPTDQNTISDPLRQPLNPLGSRTEISQTIMWIKTHLEEDPELSLPKQEVYNEYTLHCASNKMKPLSTADFGKVMKQVYPSVRPRRLGTRGNSRYCYAGLRKRFKLEIPQLPDLADRQKSTDRLAQNSTEKNSAAWYIVKKWAEDQLGTSFNDMCTLALYLLKNVCPMFQTHSAAAPLCNLETDCLNKSENQDLPSPNILSLKHKEAQIQLQKKLQQREVNREQKRKLQVSLGKTIEPSGKSAGKCKKSKISPTLTEKPTTILSNSIDGKDSIQPLPDFNNLHTQKIAIDGKNLTTQKSTNNLSRSNSNDNDIYDINQIGNEVELKPNLAGKLPLPRLPNLNKIKQPNLLLAPPKNLNTTKNRVRSQKYKNIQPKNILPKCDNFSSQERNQTQVETSDILLGDDQLKDIEIITRERLISVSNVDKDALDDYLHGGNNSQEQEEELLQYFKNNTSNNNNDSSLNESIGSQSATTMMGDEDLSNSSKSDKLSQLRLLLEQNLNNPSQIANNQTENTFVKVEKNTYATLPTSTTVLSGTKRRVSFETPILEDPVPPSPNTRRKNFSFTPISPGPHSPSGRQSKSSSTNASPFVSPRNTPVPRSKITVNHSQTTSFIAQNSGRKNIKPTLKYKTESDFFADNEQNERIKPFINSKCNLPMSAPPSPMLPLKQKQSNSNLLQKLLDSNSKIPYTPDYEKNLPTPISPEVSQLISSNQFGGVPNSYRSQSVPLHQMASNLMSPCLPSNQSQFNFNFENNSVPATPAAEFTEFEAFPETDILNNGLNNENLNQIFNILDNTQPNQLDVQDSNQNENIFNFPATSALAAEMNLMPLDNDILQPNPINKPIRSQSIDEISNISQKTYQLSRSVPSTPLPYKNKLDKPLELTLNNNQLLTDLYESDPKILSEQQDFLLNGTPVTKKKFTFDSNEINVNENNSFPQSLGFMMNDNSNNLNNEKFNFGNHNNNNRRNLNSILEQPFENETDEFTTVPI